MTRDKMMTVRVLVVGVLLAALGMAMVGVAAWLMPTCHHGDRGFYIGGSMFMGGCPDKR